MSRRPPSAYNELCRLSRELHLLANTSSLAAWDQETCLPPAGVAFRAKQLAYLSGKHHALFTDPRVGEWIAACEATGGSPASRSALNVREWRYHYDRASKLPQQLVEEFEETKALAHAAWAEAREKSEFGLFQPHLEKIVKLRLEMAQAWGYEQHPYDALLEEYERGVRTEELEKLFDNLQPDLVSLVAEATEGRPRVAPDYLAGKYPLSRQRAFNRLVAEGIGFDFQAGRIDTAVHPFCTTLGPRDVRLTTRYNRKNFTSSLYGVLHEAGHGMYEQGLPSDEDQAHLPLSRAISLGIHESQSRLWENHVGRSKAFWKRWLPVAADHFPHLQGLKLAKVALAVNQAKKSFIRVEADEVTYDLHIILRFRLEKALIDGSLSVREIPAHWNALVKQLFGLKVKKDRDGCLQDVHWSFGLIGYFPTYSLGNINAAQLFHHARRDASVAEELDKGRCEALLVWLREKIHRHGSRYLPNELMKRATGELPQAHHLLHHLRERYLP